MLTTTFLTKPFILRSTLVCALSLGLGSTAIAAESEAASMAGNMQSSGATSSASTMAGESGSNQASGSSGTMSTTDRSTASSGYDSAMDTPTRPVPVKDLAAAKTVTGKNAGASSNNGKQLASKQNGLIQNLVRQKDSDFVTTGGGLDKSLSSAAPPAAVAKTPHVKVQYWNQRKHPRAIRR